MSANHPNLLATGSIGSLQLKNHVIMGPTETLYASCHGEVTRPIIDYYVRRAKGGAGLIVLQSGQGNTKMDPIDPYPGSLRFDDNAYIPMLTQLTEEVHRAGAKISALISAGGGAQAMGFPYDRGSQGIEDQPNVAPGDKQSMVAQRPVRKMTVEEIKNSIEAFGLSVGRAKTSGFDAVTIHAVGGYLISEFMTPYFNNRDDEYGGSLENRMRFLLEIIEASQKYAGKDFPLIVRMSIDEFVGDAGRGVEESVKIGKMLEEAGVAAIDCSAAIFESMHMLIPPIYVPEGALVPLAEAMKNELSIPVIAQGRLYEPDTAEAVLADGKADFVSLSRAWIAEPDWVNKVASGDTKGIRRCLTCNYCIGKRVLGNLPLRCAVNPEAGRESEGLNPFKPATNPKKVSVIGAGPAGLEAAYVLGKQGHTVDVYEATDSLCGGQLSIASVPPSKSVLNYVPDFFKEQLSRMPNVNIHLNSPIGKPEIDALDSDIALLATGAAPIVPNIPGIDGPNVYTADQVLKGDAILSGKVAIAGGGQIGCDTAHYLIDKGCEVSIIEMLPAIALKEELITMLTITHILQSSGAEIMTNTCISQFTESGVDAQNTETGESTHIDCDSIVVACGSKSENSLYEALAAKMPTVAIGDSNCVGNVQTSIESGFFAALDI